MGWSKRVGLVVAVLSSTSLQIARADDGEVAVTLCRYTTDRAAELVRQGDEDRAAQWMPQLRKCIPILRDAQMRAAKRIVDQFDAATASAAKPKIPAQK